MAKTLTFSKTFLESYRIGRKLRVLRTEKKLTLSRLAAQTDLSTALLSKLETGRMTPTLPTLATICSVYGVGLSHFFTVPERHTLSVTRKAHLEAHYRGESVKSVPLHVPISNSALIAEMVDVPASSTDALHSALSRETCGLVYVIEGRLEVDVGDIREVLNSGDCVFIESLTPMVWNAVGKARCRVLAVRAANPPIYPQDNKILEETDEDIIPAPCTGASARGTRSHQDRLSQH